MKTATGLERFIDAQHRDYATALAEMQRGRKVTHWMWYIFPQIRGLGSSETSKYYAIKNVSEAEEFLKHPALGPGLINICRALLDQQSNDANRIFGSPDNLKLRSSMTLFASLPATHPVFQEVLERFFGAEKDRLTLQIMQGR